MHDVTIIGAGPVGATLLLALADSGLDVVALDARAKGETLRGDRSLALSHGARLILERLGAWPRLATIPDAVTPIREIDVSQARGFGTVRLAAADHGLPALGYVVSYLALQRALDDAIAYRGLAVRHGVTVDTVRGEGAHATVSVAGDPQPLRAGLAVVADGSGASVAGIARERHDYRQHALIARVWLDRPHDGVAYERFTADGPVALLPEGDHYGLVWTLDPDRVAAAIAMPEPRFLAELAARVGGRVRGFVRVDARRAFPLVLERARPSVAPHVAVIGNAAQTLHPVAGQGFNLGLRDAFELARTIMDADVASIGSHAMLARYAATRRIDRGAGVAFTHGLVHLFGTDHAIVRWPRGIALALLDALPPARRAFTRAMLFGV